MSGLPTDPSALTLHATRLLGFAESHRIVHRYRLDRDQTEECLLDFEAHGWVTRSEFAGTGGWALTERGRAESERRLAAEVGASGGPLGRVGRVPAVRASQPAFSGRRDRWHVRGMPWDSMAANDPHRLPLGRPGDRGAGLGRTPAGGVGGRARGRRAEVRRLRRPVRRCAGPGDTRVGPDGSMGWASTHAMSSSCSSTKTSWPPSVCIAATSRDVGQLDSTNQAGALPPRGTEAYSLPGRYGGGETHCDKTSAGDRAPLR